MNIEQHSLKYFKCRIKYHELFLSTYQIQLPNLIKSNWHKGHKRLQVSVSLHWPSCSHKESPTCQLYSVTNKTRLQFVLLSVGSCQKSQLLPWQSEFHLHLIGFISPKKCDVLITYEPLQLLSTNYWSAIKNTTIGEKLKCYVTDDGIVFARLPIYILWMISYFIL